MIKFSLPSLLIKSFTNIDSKSALDEKKNTLNFLLCFNDSLDNYRAKLTEK